MDSICNTELCLRPAGHCPSPDTRLTSMVEGWFEKTVQDHNQQQKKKQQQITFFYGGQIYACGVTEIQAANIICMAKREMDDKTMDKSHHHHHHYGKESSPPTSALPQLLNSGLSMKRSLQRFLQTRRTRIHASSPYNHKPQLPSLPSV